MIDSVTALNAVTVTATGTTEANFTETSVATKTTWSNCVLHIMATNASTATKAGEGLTLYYAFSPFTGQANASALRGIARTVTIPLPTGASATTITSTGLIPASGSSLYIWLAHDDWNIARTLTVTAAGLP